MTDDGYRDMVNTHDKHIDKLAYSVEVLAENVTSTNKKLDSVIDVITQQNVLQERLNNIDDNYKVSFKSLRERVKTVEEVTSAQMSTQTLRWIIGIIIVYSVSFTTYVEQNLTSLRLLAVEKIQMQKQINKQVNSTLERLSHAQENF